MRIKIAEHLRYLPMGYFNSSSIGEISSITTNTMEILGDVAARVVMLTMQIRLWLLTKEELCSRERMSK